MDTVGSFAEYGMDRADTIMSAFMGEMLSASTLDALVDIETRALAWCETDRIERDGAGGLKARMRIVKIRGALNMALDRLCQ